MGESISRAECDTCDWVLTREDVLDRLEGMNAQTSDRRIREKFGSLREGHAYFNRGHAPDYIYEDDE